MTQRTPEGVHRGEATGHDREPVGGDNAGKPYAEAGSSYLDM
jgi:hypothetical protein